MSRASSPQAARGRAMKVFSLVRFVLDKTLPQNMNGNSGTL